MKLPSYNELLEAGVHYGHLKRKWNPKMLPYIFMERKGIHIIDLNRTHMQASEIEACYCLGNLTGDSAQNKDLIQKIRKHKIFAIQGANDWCYAPGSRK